MNTQTVCKTVTSNFSEVVGDYCGLKVVLSTPKGKLKILNAYADVALRSGLPNVPRPLPTQEPNEYAVCRRAWNKFFVRFEAECTRYCRRPANRGITREAILDYRKLLPPEFLLPLAVVRDHESLFTVLDYYRRRKANLRWQN